MIGPKIYHNRSQRPAWWLAAARANWHLRCQYRLPPDLPPLEQVVQEPSDVVPYLALLREQKQKIDPIFLATRPPYMSREGPQAEPSHESYLSFFERMILSSESIATMTAEEVKELLAPFQDLPQFRIITPIVERRWAYEREHIWAKRRQAFRQRVQSELIAEALHPRRVERLLGLVGFDGLLEIID